MSFPILPKNNNVSKVFSWNKDDIVCSHTKSNSTAQVEVIWNNCRFIVKVIDKNPRTSNAQLKELLLKEMDVTILLMSRFMTDKIESLSYDSSDQKVTKKYVDKTVKPKTKTFHPQKLGDDLKSKDKGRLNPKAEARNRRIDRTQKFYKILVENRQHQLTKNNENDSEVKGKKKVANRLVDVVDEEAGNNEYFEDTLIALQLVTNFHDTVIVKNNPVDPELDEILTLIELEIKEIRSADAKQTDRAATEYISKNKSYDDLATALDLLNKFKISMRNDDNDNDNKLADLEDVLGAIEDLVKEIRGKKPSTST